MSRRRFLKTSALLGAGALTGQIGVPVARAQQTATPVRVGRPTQILMGGYGPPTTSFSLALEQIGARLTAKFGDEVDVKYVYNVMDVAERRQCPYLC